MTSKIKVDNITDQGGNNMVVKCGTTQTLGTTGVTVALASGASQTGFGRTGTVDWQTGSIKTATFTAANGQGFFADTSSGGFTMNLPASPSAGNIVSVKDYDYSFGSNNLTVGRNGSPIGGQNVNDLTISTDGSALTFIYVDSTKGWLVINESTDTSQGVNPLFVAATGGTVTCCGNYKIHTFSSPGNFVVTCAGNSAGNNNIDYMVLAGGGGGGGGRGGGGGAGGFRESRHPCNASAWTASPLASTTSLNLPAATYPITIGAGGAGGAGGCTRARGTSGSNTTLSSSITSAGGGGAGSEGTAPGIDGGSGGGAALGTVGAGNTPSVSPPQGNPGSNGSGGPSGIPGVSAGGGGGATAAGTTNSRDGGAGATTSISASPTAYAGGGGGAGNCVPGGSGGTGGGAAGAPPGTDPAASASANTGGGGGGGRGTVNRGTGGSGGSGLVIIRYKYQ